MRFALPFALLAVVPAAAAALAAASLPAALKGGGMWEISRSASGADGERQCLADAALLTQWEHRRGQCTRVIVSGTSDKAQVHYTCTGGGFGTSYVSVLTPRSVRIETQGISDGLPFHYTLHARRAGDCPR